MIRKKIEIEKLENFRKLILEINKGLFFVGKVQIHTLALKRLVKLREN